MNEDDDDSSSQDDDYRPTEKEIKDAEGDERQSKRHRLAHGEGDTVPQASKGSVKVEELWQQLRAPKSRQGGVGSLISKASQRTSNIAAADREWMRQLGVLPSTSAGSKQAKATAPESKAEPVEQMLQQQQSQAPPSDHQTKPPMKPVATSVAAAALAAAKMAMSNANAQAAGQVSVMETRRFAGKDVQVRKLTTAEEAEQLERKEREKKKAGLDAVLASLESAKKVNVLDKSRDDWGTFKDEDAKVADELEAYKKSGGKYLDKVDFLKRAELREYEAERDKRLAGDARLRGR